MINEYDYEEIPLAETERRMVEVGMADVGTLNVKIKNIINDRAKNGWEPLYPFSVPYLWFKRQIVKKSRKK